jgi:biopolymer transport protein TolR
MNRILVVCFVGLTLAAYSAQTAPQLQPGISVEMPVTKNASLVPEADQEDALIVTMRDDGRVYLGVNAIEPDAAAARLREFLSHRQIKTVYIKADACAPYATVMNLIDQATAVGSERTVLLTARRELPTPGTITPPSGFTVVTGGSQMKSRAKLSL